MRTCVRLSLILATIAALFSPAKVASAYPRPNVDLQGHGWGHGRGMGQWGALGYSLNHGWDYQRILGHYYSNTSMGSMANEIMRVRMTYFDNRTTFVYQPRGLMTTSADGDVGKFAALWAVKTGSNAFDVYHAPGCGGPWQLLRSGINHSVWFNPPDLSPDAPLDNLLVLCEDGGNRWIRGKVNSVTSTDPDDPCSACTVNQLEMESYLRGVVPRESPAYWGTLGGGRGMEALRAQAVAARSYGWAESRRVAKTCDTTSCQVYGGAAYPNQETPKEHPLTDQAIRETAGKIRTLNGAVARTEFSSSTGGWTAPGTFPSVDDAGDSVEGNPNHLWQVSIPATTVGSRFGVGTLTAFDVVERNGRGDWGGRVTRVRIQGTSGTVYKTGSEVRSALGLKSDWFRVVAEEGYWIAASDGGVFSFGSADFYGSMGGRPLARPITAIAPTSSKRGYWLAATDGGIFAFGDAGFHGSTGGMPLARPVVGMAPTGSAGYWLVADDGGIFAFGDAGFHGSMGGRTLAKPVVGMAPTPTGNGYWLVASDGGIFAFGDAGFHGSMGGRTLAKPIVGMAATPTGNGYWLVASDGGIFAFGDARFLGSMGGRYLAQPVVGMAPSPSGSGYYLVARDGGIFNFGDAIFWGSVPGVAPSNTAKVGVAVSYPKI